MAVACGLTHSRNNRIWLISNERQHRPSHCLMFQAVV